MPTGRRTTTSGRSECASSCARFANSRRVSCSFVTGSTNRIAPGARARASDNLPNRFVLVLTEDTRSFTPVASVAAAKFYIQAGLRAIALSRIRLQPDAQASAEWTNRSPDSCRWRTSACGRDLPDIGLFGWSAHRRIADVRTSTTTVLCEAGANHSRSAADQLPNRKRRLIRPPKRHSRHHRLHRFQVHLPLPRVVPRIDKRHG